MTAKAPPPPPLDPMGSYLDMPEERRVAARSHVAVISATVREVAKTLPLGADVDDFRRVLVSEASR